MHNAFKRLFHTVTAFKAIGIPNIALSKHLDDDGFRRSFVLAIGDANTYKELATYVNEARHLYSIYYYVGNRDQALNIANALTKLMWSNRLSVEKLSSDKSVIAPNNNIVIENIKPTTDTSVIKTDNSLSYIDNLIDWQCNVSNKSIIKPMYAYQLKQEYSFIVEIKKSNGKCLVASTLNNDKSIL